MYLTVCEPKMMSSRFDCVKDMEYNIRIANVSEVPSGISLSRWEIRRYAGGEITVGLTSRFTGHADRRVVTLVIGASYTCMRHMMRHRLLDYTIAVDFELDRFDEILIEEGGMSVPPRLMALMYSVAIGALRGMLAMRTAGTFLSDYPLPLINVSALVSEHVSGQPVSGDVVPFSDLYYN